MEQVLKPPGPMLWTGNVAENWKNFRQQFELYLTAIGYEKKTSKEKSSLLLCTLGPEGINLYNSFKLEADDQLNFSTITERFETYCCPRKNVTYERYKFNSCRQKPEQNIDQFVTELKLLAKSCEFGQLNDSLIRDRIVCGIANNQVREALLREEELTLLKAINACRSKEVTQQQAVCINNEPPEMSVNRVQADVNQVLPKRPNCKLCDWRHQRYRCPAYGKVCFKCGAKNHFSRCCDISTGPNQSYRAVAEVSRDSDQEFQLSSVSTNSNTDWHVSLEVNGSIMQFKVDTGSQVNIITRHAFNQLQCKVPLVECKSVLLDYSRNPIPVAGKCTLFVKINEKTYELVFVVVNNRYASLIIGLQGSEVLNLLHRVQSVESSCAFVDDVYKDVFIGLGCIPGEHTIRLDPEVPPVVHVCRRVPLALRDKLKTELQRMETLGVIQKVNEPTAWVNSLVIVNKPNGKLRVCLDPRDLNKAIMREYFALPTRRELMAQFAKAQYFSKLDALSGFWQMKLTEESSKLCTFNTPFGRYRFVRLPFGISSAPEVFHKAIHLLHGHIEEVDIFMDDIIVWGRSKKEHDERLEKVLTVTRQANLKLNREKCLFGVQSLTFMGDLLCKDGLKPDPRKIAAIVEMRKPTSVKDLQSFLGMVNFSGQFIPNLAAKSACLRELTNKQVTRNGHHRIRQNG